MKKTIPGYYFDEATGKYFKLDREHAIAERNARSETFRARQIAGTVKQQQKQQTKNQNSSLLQLALSSIPRKRILETIIQSGALSFVSETIPWPSQIRINEQPIISLHKTKNLFTATTSPNNHGFFCSTFGNLPQSCWCEMPDSVTSFDFLNKQTSENDEESKIAVSLLGSELGFGRAVICSVDNLAHLCEEISYVDIPNSSIYSCCWNQISSENMVSLGCSKGRIWIWDPEYQRSRLIFNDIGKHHSSNSSDVTFVSFDNNKENNHNNGMVCIAGRRDGRIHLFDLRNSNNARRTYMEHICWTQGAVTCLKFIGSYLIASASSMGMICIYDLRNASNPLITLANPVQTVVRLEFDLNDSQNVLVAGTADLTTRCWDFSSNFKLLSTLRFHTATTPQAISFSPCHQSFLIASQLGIESHNFSHQ